ncbi:hypothetical protein CY34DRAFT_191380 [Suillus luteus UH-Slu-Lm8-n1]|uniref:Uncharacterized protein n=1 Tax=Suillus luteus UH-Slu-Lm8-n1 TaxID=930992 RepID=A0A0D0BXR5_9AGAM|nr:hypothetical protein CY34DRAFT_191380 [Suillus luteus UH-Slu-Lm8-n1]
MSIIDSIKKWFQKRTGDKKPSLKHSKSMPFRRSQASMLEPCADPFKAIYHGKTPSKPSNIVPIEQAPRTPHIRREQWYPDVHEHLPSRTRTHTHANLLHSFPNPSPPPPRHTRSVLRSTSLNALAGSSIRPRLPPQKCITNDQHVAGRQRIVQQHSLATRSSQPTLTASPSAARKRRREATADQAVADLLKTLDGRAPVFGSSRQAERVRAQSNAGHAYTHVPPVTPDRSPRPLISHSACNSRTNLNRSRDWR